MQEKVFKIDQHLGVSVSGLIADARVLSKFMHSEALNHRFVFSSDMQVARLVQMVADKSQVCVCLFGQNRSHLSA